MGTEIEAVMVDKRQNVWAVTDFPGSHDPHNRASMAPVVELKAAVS